MKKTLSILLSVLLLFGTCVFALPAAAEEPAIIAQGYCGAEGDGTNLRWTLDKDYTVTISGTGEMADFPDGNLPWDDAIFRDVFNAMGYTSDEEIQQALADIEDGLDARQYCAYITAYNAARKNLQMVFEEGLTGISRYGLNVMRQSSLTLPASLEHIESYSYAHSLITLTVLGKGSVSGIEVPAYKKGALHPQTAEDYEAGSEVGIGSYYLSVFLSQGLDQLIKSFASNYHMTPEEIEENYDRLADMVIAIYATSTGVSATTVQEMYNAWTEMINRNLGTSFTPDDIFSAAEDENGQVVYTYSDAFNDAVTARFGYPANAVLSLGGPDSGLHSVPIEQIGTEYEAAPWFTLCAPAGSATEALALEKGIAFEAIPRCPVSDEHLVKEGAAIAPTCTEAGHSKGWYCADCGTWLSGESIDPLNHKNAQNLAAADATEAAHGHTAGVWCPDCETWLSGGEVIHNHLGEQTVIKPATDTEEGLVDIVCTVCGETIRYTASTTGPEPDENGNTEGGFWQRITGFFRGFIDWFLRLFKWFGKK